MPLSKHTSSQPGPEAIPLTDNLEKLSIDDRNNKLREAEPKRPAFDDDPGSTSMAVISATEITDLRRKSSLAMPQDARPIKDLSKFVRPVHWAFVSVDNCMDNRIVEHARDEFDAMLQKHGIQLHSGHILNPPSQLKTNLGSTVTWARLQLSRCCSAPHLPCLLCLIIQEKDYKEYTGTLPPIAREPENQDVIIQPFIRSCINNWRNYEYRRALEELIASLESIPVFNLSNSYIASCGKGEKERKAISTEEREQMAPESDAVFDGSGAHTQDDQNVATGASHRSEES